jgi:hypothetical protein
VGGLAYLSVTARVPWTPLIARSDLIRPTIGQFWLRCRGNVLRYLCWTDAVMRLKWQTDCSPDIQAIYMAGFCRAWETQTRLGRQMLLVTSALCTRICAVRI